MILKDMIIVNDKIEGEIRNRPIFLFSPEVNK